MHYAFRALLPYVVAAAWLETPASTQAPVLHQVVPAAHAQTDANSHVWIPGASQPVREQTLVGAHHLAALAGREITALEFRRSAANEVYQGGSAQLTLHLSIAPHGPLDCSTTFAANSGPAPVLVHQGLVTFPTSPAVTTVTDPWTPVPVPWTPANTVRIAFQQPFLYVGGTLCVDLVGTPVPGSIVTWWMADAAFEDLSGSVLSIGNGCGAFGGPTGEWSWVSERSLLPGNYASFSASGTRGGIAIAAFGIASPVPIPISTFGVPAPGCDCHLLPSLELTTFLRVFAPEAHPLLQNLAWGSADVAFKVPALNPVLGFTLTTQWLDLAQPATSNAITWRVGSSIPSLGMALVDGVATEPDGHLSVHLAHVFRFEHRAP